MVMVVAVVVAVVVVVVPVAVAMIVVVMTVVVMTVSMPMFIAMPMPMPMLVPVMAVPVMSVAVVVVAALPQLGQNVSGYLLGRRQRRRLLGRHKLADGRGQRVRLAHVHTQPAHAAALLLAARVCGLLQSKDNGGRGRGRGRRRGGLLAGSKSHLHCRLIALSLPAFFHRHQPRALLHGSPHKLYAAVVMREIGVSFLCRGVGGGVGGAVVERGGGQEGAQ